MIHIYADRSLPRICEQADKTCRGRLECALRKDAPPDLIRVSGNTRYFVGEPCVGYMRLCLSHHRRYDGWSQWAPSMGAKALSFEARSRAGKAGSAAAYIVRKERGDYDSPEWIEQCVQAGRVGAVKANCTRWRINRGLSCICGKHVEVAS